MVEFLFVIITSLLKVQQDMLVCHYIICVKMKFSFNLLFTTAGKNGSVCHYFNINLFKEKVPLT
jgi:hypothetical protein